MSSYDYHQLLKFLYFEGYADSYAEAENLLEEMNDEEFENLISEIEEEKKPFPTERVERQIDKHLSKASASWSSRGGKSDPRKTHSYKARYRKMNAIKNSVERGEDPRNNQHGHDERKIYTKEYGTHVSAKTVDNEKSAYTPGGLRAHQTRAGGYRTLTKKEEVEMQEEGTTLNEEKRRAHSFPLKPSELRSVEKIRAGLNNQEPEKITHSAPPRQSRTKRKLEYEVRENFNKIAEYLFVEGYTDTIESAEVMVENISAEWANEILEAKVDWYNRDQSDVTDRVRVLRDRNKRNVDPSIPDGYKTASRRTRHELSRGKKQQKGLKTNYDNLGNMNRSRYRQQQFKRTGNDLYKG